MGKAIAILGAMLACNIVLTIHQTLQVKQFKEKTMADIDTLSTALDSISTEIDKISAETSTLVAELQAANQSPAVDLSAVIAKAQAIEAKLQAVDDLVPDAPVTEPAPTDTPTA